MSELAKSRLFDLNRQRDKIIATVEERVVSNHLQAAWDNRSQGLEYVLNEAAYFEMLRLEKSRKKRHKEQYATWHDLAVKVGQQAEDENAELLASLVRDYARDIVGTFNPWVFRLATRVIPFGLNAFFNAKRLPGLLSEVHTLSSKVLVHGEIERLQRLSQRGSLVVVPTHSSNMDSILVGWALESAGLPPVTYGAGKNLFRAPLTAFFMRNLGAYKVDRRLRHSLYKDVLKTV
jgi:glycerol-3-phosphate O-acyltransferase